VQGIDSFSLLAVRDEDSKVELIYQWVQNLIVNAMKNGVLTIPSPITTRIFQELEGGGAKVAVACIPPWTSKNGSLVDSDYWADPTANVEGIIDAAAWNEAV